MRFASVVVVLFGLAGCYDQPKIPRDRPLTCRPVDAGDECPSGFVCVGGQLCAPRNCIQQEDCPAALVCGPRGTCVFPPGDGSVSVDPPTPDAGAPDAPNAPSLDAGAFDAAGGS